VGANAQGKTSLLEAVHFLVGASSPHAGSDRQLINFLALEEAQPVSRIVAEIERAGQTRRIEIRIILDPVGQAGETRLRKEILINGVKKRVRDLAAGFNAVLFLPQDMRVIEGSPGDRRRHLDHTLSQGDSTYATTYSQQRFYPSATPCSSFFRNATEAWTSCVSGTNNLWSMPAV